MILQGASFTISLQSMINQRFSKLMIQKHTQATLIISIRRLQSCGYYNEHHSSP